jgi:hypothetical protein
MPANGWNPCAKCFLWVEISAYEALVGYMEMVPDLGELTN